jgi:REP element-mobilizing transposase RayT
MAGYKSAVAKRANALRGTPGAAVWQRSYYEHVVRDEGELQGIRQYIAENPSRWASAPGNPGLAVRLGVRAPLRT